MTHPDFNPSLHPRGRGGRFTRSFSRHATPAQHQRGRDVMARFSPVKGANPLAGYSGDKAAVADYTRDFATINATLRAGKADTPQITALDRAMKPLPHDTVLTRAVPLDQFGRVKPSALAGFVVRDAGFFSATAVEQPPQPGTVLLRVQAPTGTKAVADPDTGQVVLDRGLDMLVQGVRDTPAGPEMALTVLPADGNTPAVDEAPPQPPASTSAEPATPATTPTGDPGFDRRAAAALTGTEALQSTPLSLLRGGFFMDSEREALADYRGVGYHRINGRLRGQIEDTGDRVSRIISRQITDMDDAMRDSRLNHEVLVHRGLDGRSVFGDRMDGDLTGMEWREDAYVSTSARHQIADNFAEGGTDTAPMVMRIIAPAGIGGIEMSDVGSESELLLQRGLRMRIVADHGVQGGLRRVDVEVVPVGD